MSDELIERVAQAFIISWADHQDETNILEPGSSLAQLIDAHEDRDTILQAGYRKAVDRYFAHAAKV